MRHLVRGMVPATLVLVLAACSQGGTTPAETPIELSAAQIAALQKAYDRNARPTQPLNGRQVTLDSQR